MSSFQPVKNDTFLRALRREATEYTPVWLMRQAGRYLPEYRATRAKAGNFMGLCTNPEAACEVTLQPLERYKLDAAILFSDILTVPDAMGLGLYFAEGEGPKFERPLVTEADVAKLAVPDIGTSLRYVTDAVSTIRGALGGRVPLIGFSGSPWTLACYMVEGGGLWLEDIASSGASAVGVDWTVNLGQARARIGDRCAIQGNLDPTVLFAEPAQIEAEVAKALESFGVPQAGAGHVFNLGHGISQFTNPDSVEVMVNAVHAYSRKQRQ